MKDFLMWCIGENWTSNFRSCCLPSSPNNANAFARSEYRYILYFERDCQRIINVVQFSRRRNGFLHTRKQEIQWISDWSKWNYQPEMTVIGKKILHVHIHKILKLWISRRIHALFSLAMSALLSSFRCTNIDSSIRVGGGDTSAVSHSPVGGGISTRGGN